MKDFELISLVNKEEGQNGFSIASISYDIFKEDIYSVPVNYIAQAFITNLLMSSDPTEESNGRAGNLLMLLRRHRSYSNATAAAVSSAIRSVEQYMLQEQSSYPFQPENMLQKVDILRIEEGDSPDTIDIEIVIFAQDGSSFFIKM